MWNCAKPLTFPGCGQPALREVAHPCELFDTDFESDPAQRLKMPGAFKPPCPPALLPPKRPCGIRAYKTPVRPRWGLCFTATAEPVLQDRPARHAPLRVQPGDHVGVTVGFRSIGKCQGIRASRRNTHGFFFRRVRHSSRPISGPGTGRARCASRRRASVTTSRRSDIALGTGTGTD